MLKMNIKTPQTFKLKIKTHFPNIILANLQEKEIEPTKEEQIVEADFGYDGLKQVNVKPIPSEYIKPTGTKEIIENGIHNVKEFENVDVNVSYTPNYQEKNVTPTKEMQIIIADENYDALEKVNVSSIPDEYIIPSGNLDITENGSYNVKDKESVNVEIASGGGDLSEYFDDTITNGYQNRFGWTKSIKKIPRFTFDGTSCAYLFASCNGVVEIDLTNIFTGNTTTMEYMFEGCEKLTSLDLSKFNTENVTSMRYMFENCIALTSLDLSNFETPKLTSTNYMFSSCKKLTFIDMRNMDFTNVTSNSNMFGSSANFGVPSNCLIIVKDETTKSWIQARRSDLTNVKTIAEYEA